MRPALVFAIFLALTGGSSAGDMPPLMHAHAHNDYAHARPLLDALDHGLTSVEADIWLMDGELRVAHGKPDTRPGRTLQSLYLDPLRARIEANGGYVMSPDAPFRLLIDLKTPDEDTYHALTAVLAGYEDILTVVRDGTREPGPVTALVGNSLFKLIAADNPRRVLFDAQFFHLGIPMPENFVGQASGKWSQFFSWKGKGEMPENEHRQLVNMVERAHAKGATVRFWGTPDKPGSERDNLWQTLLDAGVDYINSDDLDGLENFLRARQ